MLKSERADKILDILSKQKYATVEELVRKIHYSPATVRRDLTALSRLGLITKHHGGVSLNTHGRPMPVREHDHAPEKLAICEAVTEYIPDGSVVFIDSSTTTYPLGRLLTKKKDLTVFTNSLKLAMLLYENGIRCCVTGGFVSDTATLSSLYSCDLLEKITFDVCVFSVGALSDEGYMGAAAGLWELHRKIIQNARRAILACDKSKLIEHKQRKMYFGSLKEVGVVVSDKPLPKRLTAKYPETTFLVAKK